MLYALYDHPLLQPRGELDTAAYVRLAFHPTRDAYFVSPLYLYFLRACGGSLLAARIVQIILGALGVVLIFDTARRWFGDRAALVAASLAILTGVISFYEVTILQTALDPFLVALTLWTLVATPRTEITGVALGLFILSRPNALLWLPVLLVALLWQRGWRAAAACALGVLVPLAPVTVRNYAVAHRVVLVATHGGLNLFIGNNPEADGTYHHVAGIRPTIEGQEFDAPRVEAQQGSFSARALRWVGTHPFDATRLFLRKLAYAFNEADLSLNYSYAYFRHDVVSPLRFLIVGPWLLFPLGIAGALRNVRDRAFAVWATFVPVYAIGVAIFFVSSRYRLPLLIPMCVCAAGLLVQPRWRDAAVACVVAVIVLWNFGLDEGRAHERTNMIVYLIEQRRFDEAMRLAADTEGMTRDPVALHQRSAMAFAAAGDRDDALAMLRRLAADGARNADAARVARGIGIEAVRENRTDQSLLAFESAHALEPGDASDALNLAVLHAQRGDLAAATSLAREALALRPGYPQAEGLLRAIGTR